ncbi:SDR family oxidoreductase [Achromobacter xylosoxidans]|uniref:SDR family oxidoreductase n=1 Tax=Alcaligenes xylosoxydans xylosoxydans TaxID=85698 RepID=UPI001F12F13D|nr:SDR family oxidoreductase [Achromobacter xylosoxidans]
MKIVVIGGTGLIGSNVVRRLRANGHEVVAASPRTGVDTLTGAGLAEALAGAQVVVDVSNSPSFEDQAVMAFFETSGRNLLAAAARAGVEHYVVLSVVGAERLPQSGYMRAKVVQENLVRASKTPYTILRATQFFEFVEGIVGAGAQGDMIRLSPALVQPIAADDVAAVLADLAVATPINGMVEVGGPDRFPLDELGRKFLAARGDKRQVVADVHARYFGSELDDRSLVAAADARKGPTRFHNWLIRPAA